jgi:hypothetical protein
MKTTEVGWENLGEIRRRKISPPQGKYRSDENHYAQGAAETFAECGPRESRQNHVVA